MWKGEELPALWWPSRGLHPPAAEPSRTSGRYERSWIPVILWRGREAVRPVPPWGTVHASSQRAGLPPLPRAGRWRWPGAVSSGNWAQPILCVCSRGQPIRAAYTLYLEGTEAQTDQWACKIPPHFGGGQWAAGRTGIMTTTSQRCTIEFEKHSYVMSR